MTRSDGRDDVRAILAPTAGYAWSAVAVAMIALVATIAAVTAIVMAFVGKLGAFSARCASSRTSLGGAELISPRTAACVPRAERRPA